MKKFKQAYLPEEIKIATITSKKQLTPPALLFEKAGLRVGQKVVVSEKNGSLTITPARKLVEELAGSLKMPKKWRGKSLDEIIEQSKQEYFRFDKKLSKEFTKISSHPTGQ